MEITSQQLDACIKAAIEENAIKVIDLLYEIKHSPGDAKLSTLATEPPSSIQISLPCDLAAQGLSSPIFTIDKRKGYVGMKIALGLIFKTMEVGTSFNFSKLAVTLEADDLSNPWLDRTFNETGNRGERWRDYLSTALYYWRANGYIERQTMRTHYKLVRAVSDYDLANTFSLH